MRPFILFLFSVSSFTLATHADDKKYSPRKGDCKDEHGDIQWLSTVERAAAGSDDWTYSRHVTNRSPAKRCRVTWENKGINAWTSTLDPKETAKPGTTTVDMPPEELGGKIRYNGGPAAGEGKADAPAWFPKGHEKTASKPRKSNSTAEVKLDLPGGEVRKVDIRADSEVDVQANARFTIRYSLTVTSPEGKFNLPSSVRVRWTSIEHKGLRELVGNVPERESKTLKLDEDGKFKAELDTEKRPELWNGTIQFLSKRSVKEKEEILAEAWLPAYGPAK
jgi:hypothetical protein